MKNILFTPLIALCVIMITCCAANAQTASKLAMVSLPYEKIISLHEGLYMAEDSNFHFYNGINSRAVRGFLKEFKDIDDVKWIQYEKGFVASFEKDSINTRIYYNQRGDFEMKIRYYYENRLSPDIRKLVRSKYYDYSIFHISEVSENGGTFYLIKIQDKNYWKTIRIINWEMEVIQEYSASR